MRGFFKDRVKKHLQWDNLIQECDYINLPDAEKEDAKKALRYLKQMLTNDFPYDAWESQHPISDYFTLITTPWRCRHVILLAESIRSLTMAQGFSDLLEKIKNTKHIDGAVEALSILDIAYKFHNGGFSISFLDQAKNRNATGFDPTPDLKLIDCETGDEVFVELSILGTSEAQRKANHIYTRIWQMCDNIMNAEDLILRGQICVPLDSLSHEEVENKIGEIQCRVRQLANEAKRSNNFIKLEIPDLIDIGIAPALKEGQLNEWADGLDILYEIKGPHIPIKELSRTGGKILKKMSERKQLPEGKAGILIILQHNPFFQVFDLDTIALALQDKIEKYPHLICVILHHKYLSPEESVSPMIASGRHLLIRNGSNSPLAENTYILFNGSCRVALTDSTVNRLPGCFMQTNIPTLE